MYRSGYDARHFLAGSVPVLIIEVIVRIGFMARRIKEGATLIEALPFGSDPRLRAQLFWSHLIATATNAGKVYVTQNPLGLNSAQWLALFRYLGPQVKWWVLGAEQERTKYIKRYIDDEWRTIDDDFSSTWRATFTDGAAVL